MQVTDEIKQAEAEIRDAFRWPIRIVIGAAIALLAVATLVLQGCSTLSIDTPDGYHASYTRWGDQQIQGFVLERDSLGVLRVGLQKQNTDTRILEAITALLGVVK